MRPFIEQLAPLRQQHRLCRTPAFGFGPMTLQRFGTLVCPKAYNLLESKPVPLRTPTDQRQGEANYRAACGSVFRPQGERMVRAIDNPRPVPLLRPAAAPCGSKSDKQ